MKQGLIIDQESNKVGDFKKATLSYTGLWKLEGVKIHKDYFNTGTNTTTAALLFLWVQHKEKDLFDIKESIGVGFMFTTPGVVSWCSLDGIMIQEAQFIEGKKGYEN
jgi:hypothetical protein